MNRKFLVSILIVLSLSIVGCSSSDPIDDTWTTNLYPASNNTYMIGSPFNQYNSGYFTAVYLNGSLLNVSSMVGPQGQQGNSTSITINSTYTGLPGTNATVTNVGNVTNAILDFVIPQGIQGSQGLSGINGSNGSSATITINSTITGVAGSNATVTNIGTLLNAIFDFVIPQGIQGLQGIQGTSGINGSAGPNFINETTGTSLVGVLFGDGQCINASNNISASNLNLSGNITAYGITLTAPPLLAVPVWEDIRLIPGSFDRAGVTDPAYVAYSPNGGTISTYLTEWQTIDIASCTVQIPHAYKEGSDIYCHIHWTAGARGSAENGKAVGWKVDYTWTNIDAAFGNMSTLNLSDICDGVNHQHQMTPDILINGSGKTISSMLILNIKRSDTGADDTWVGTTSSNLPMMLELDLHYQIDTLGSRQILVK